MVPTVSMPGSVVVAARVCEPLPLSHSGSGKDDDGPTEDGIGGGLAISGS